MSKTFRGNDRNKFKKNFLKFKQKRLKRTIVDEVPRQKDFKKDKDYEREIY